MLTTTLPSPLGALRLVATDDALVGVYFPEHHPAPPAALASARSAPDHPVLVQAARELTEYFAGARRAFTVPIRATGTAFQQRVWAALATIPFGAAWSYGDLARAIDQPTAVRAVGGANARNPLSIIVGCHRVVGKDGKLTGYAGGLERKRFLLELEEPSAVEAGKLF